MEKEKISNMLDIEILTWFIELDADTKNQMWKISKAKDYIQMVSYIKTNMR